MRGRSKVAMDTLASRLGAIIESVTDAPRVYCDANLPAGLIRFMRGQLQWDVFFVMEEDDLRRASDIEHFRMAAQLRRTLLTLDRDYLNDVRFPPAEGSGVLVLSAPHQEQFERLLRQVDRILFRPSAGKRASGDTSRMPLLGRKLLVHTDWQGELEPS
jgi:predicted nuclease of predicted toxin-antitoxin system